MQDVRSDKEAPLRGAQVLTPDGRSLPLVSANLRVEAGGGLARIVLEQTFDNPYDDTLRVTYKMPLPVDGAVSGYAFRIGGRTITGKVDRKETARTRFEAAIATGKTAALLEQDKADIFTQEIGNIPPRCTIVAEITIDQRLTWKPEGEWELRFPTVIGPRYIGAEVPAAERRASHIELADPGGVRGRVHLELRIADVITAGRSAESPSHALQAGPGGTIELLDAEGGRLDRDVVVRWPVAKREVGLGVQVARAAAGPNGRTSYALLSIVPPAPDAGQEAIPRDLIVLLDTSGSMDGPPLEQAKRLVAALIDSLGAQDRLEVVEFSTRPHRYTKTPVPGTPREKEKAIQWVMSRKANGGTEMRSAILDALQALRPGAQRQVVLVTDGYVGGEAEIVTMLHESLPESCRMHVVGVGSAVNRALATSLARAGRGAEVLVDLDVDAERSAKHLVAKTRAPVLTDVVIGGDALMQCAPEHVPDVFSGSPVLAALQVRAQGGELVVRGNLARGTWEQRIQVPPCDPGEGNQAVVKLFGRESVADLEMRWSIGNEVNVIDREIESIGLVFQIATRKTSWLAIDDDRSVDPRLGSRHEEIPQELPYGTTMASFGAPFSQGPAGFAQAPMAQMAPMAAMGTRAGELATPSGAFSIDALRSMAPPAARSAAPRPASGMARSPSTEDHDDDDTSVSMRTMVGAPPPPQSFSLRAPSVPPPSGRDEPATLRPPPPPAQYETESAAPVTPRMPAAPSSMTPYPPQRALEPPPHAPPATGLRPWIVALIAALVFLVVFLAAILAWVLLSR